MTPSSRDAFLLRLADLPDIEAIRSPRRKKTISLCLHDDGRVTLRLPARLTIEAAQRFISSKTAWLKKKIDARRRHAPCAASRNFFDGKPIPYMGRYFPLRLSAPIEPKYRGITFSGHEFILANDLRQAARQHLFSWYKEASGALLASTINRCSAAMNVKPAAVKVSGATRRWGSCSAGNILNFSWRLAMLPQDIIDYIVIHELAHVIHKNHGPLFWNTVARSISDYRRRHRWLKDHAGHFPV